MVDRIRRFQLLNHQIFAILANFVDQGEEVEERVREFAPPIHPSIAGQQ